MQFLAAASLFAIALAAPAPAPQTSNCPNPAHCGTPTPPEGYENLDITEFFLRKNNNGLRSIGFKLTGSNATNIPCTLNLDTEPNAITDCGEKKDTDYRFVVTKPFDSSSSTANLTFYHQTGVASGKWGRGSIPTYCHAGGDGPDDFVCNQVSKVTVVITSN